MLAIGNKFKKDPAAVLLARDARTNKSIFYVPIGPYPTQRIRGNPLDLVDGDELLRIFKKYGLKKKTIAKLINFYEDSEEESLELDDDFKLKLCFLLTADMDSSQLQRKKGDSEVQAGHSCRRNGGTIQVVHRHRGEAPYAFPFSEILVSAVRGAMLASFDADL